MFRNRPFIHTPALALLGCAMAPFLTHCVTAPEAAPAASVDSVATPVQPISENQAVEEIRDIVISDPTPTPVPTSDSAMTPAPTPIPKASLEPMGPPRPAGTPVPSVKTPAPVATTPAATPAPSPSQITFTTTKTQNEKTQQPTLDTSEIQTVLGQQLPRIRSCYEKGLREFPAIEGKLTLDFQVNAKGQAVNAKVRGSRMDSPITEKCLVDLILSTPFPKPAGRKLVSIQYPLVLEWQSNFPEMQKQLKGCWEGSTAEVSLPITRVSLAFEKSDARPRAMVGRGGTESTAPKGRDKKKLRGQKAPEASPLVVAFDADVRAASLRANRLAIVLDVSDRKVGIAGTLKPGASSFVGVVQVEGKRSPMTFERKDCRMALVKQASWIQGVPVVR